MENREDKISGLLKDNRFVDWVFNPRSQYGEFWLHWISESKENIRLAEEAKQFLLSIKTIETRHNKEMEEPEISRLWAEIEEGIEHIDKQPKKNRKKYAYWLAAAFFIGVIFFSSSLLYHKPGNHEARIQQQSIENQNAGELIRYNGSPENELVFLPDGSRVVLNKGAKLTYYRLLNGEKREVMLNGEAFFDVAKDAERPFYIYTNKMVIRVLGTSFRVNATSKSESVVVKTGKVSVYLKGQDLEKAAPKILLPAQGCKYSEVEKELVTELSPDEGALKSEAKQITLFRFNDSPLDSVLRKVETMYAIPVHYNRESFRNCYITITLGNERLEDIIQVITKTVGATFTLSSEGIYIEGRGC